MQMSRVLRRTLSLVSVVLLFGLCPLFAAVIVQKNGDVISGRIIEEKADSYVFASPYGKLQIAKANIAKLILDEKTIALKNVTVGDKTVKARLINQDKNTSVYLTEDGRTIRKSETEAPTPVAAPAAVAAPRDKIIAGISAYYGFSTFQQMGTGQTGSMPPFEQSFHPNTFGFNISGHYVLSQYWGVGLNASFNRWSGTVAQSSPSPVPGFDVATSNESLFGGASLVVSLLGNLGATVHAHDLRLEVAGGAAINSANIDLAFKSPLNGFPAAASATGSNRSAALDAQLYYTYSFSESFRLRLGAGYHRIFYTNIYEPILQSASAIPGAPGGFKGDFEANLAATAVNPQIISMLLGFEIGF